MSLPRYPHLRPRKLAAPSLECLVFFLQPHPLFEYYKDDFRPFYEKKYEFLADFNEELCRLICSLIDIQPDMERTTEYKTTFTVNEDDFRDRIHPKKDFRKEDPEFTAQPYYQVFQERLGFLPNLSIVDLLFNMGPESLLVLQQSICNR